MVFMNQIDESVVPGTQNWPLFASAEAFSPRKDMQTPADWGYSASKIEKLKL